MGVSISNEAKNVIPLKFLRKIQNTFFFPLVNSIRVHTVYIFLFVLIKNLLLNIRTLKEKTKNVF
jgi:hypothetical protein